MFKVIASCCRQGDAVLEDAIGYSHDYLFVIDGASGLTDTHITAGASDAAWLAQALGHYLAENLPHARHTPIEDLLSDCAHKLARIYYEQARKKGLTIPPDAPSAGFCLFRLLDDVMEMCSLGDCVGVVRYNDGKTEILFDRSLATLDNAVIAKMLTLRKENDCSVFAARKLCQHMLIEHRALRNKANGYNIFDLSGEGIPRCLKKSVSRFDIASVSLFTDGFAQLVDTFNLIENYEELHSKLESEGAASLVERLFAAQASDPEGRAFPRFKFRDDTSVIFATVEN